MEEIRAFFLLTFEAETKCQGCMATTIFIGAIARKRINILAKGSDWPNWPTNVKDPLADAEEAMLKCVQYTIVCRIPNYNK